MEMIINFFATMFSAIALIIGGLFVGAWYVLKFLVGILLAPFILLTTTLFSAVCLQAIGL